MQWQLAICWHSNFSQRYSARPGFRDARHEELARRQPAARVELRGKRHQLSALSYPMVQSACLKIARSNFQPGQLLLFGLRIPRYGDRGIEDAAPCLTFLLSTILPWSHHDQASNAQSPRQGKCTDLLESTNSSDTYQSCSSLMMDDPTFGSRKFKAARILTNRLLAMNPGGSGSVDKIKYGRHDPTSARCPRRPGHKIVAGHHQT